MPNRRPWMRVWRVEESVDKILQCGGQVRQNEDLLCCLFQTSPTFITTRLSSLLTMYPRPTFEGVTPSEMR